MNARANPAIFSVFSGNGNCISAVGGDGELGMEYVHGVQQENYCGSLQLQSRQDTARRYATPPSSSAGGLAGSTLYKLSAMESKAIHT